MSLYNLPFGTVTAVLEAIAKSQGVPFEGKGEKQYSAPCPWHPAKRKKRESLSVNNETNQWHCFFGCGQGGVLAAVLRLAPNIAFDRRSALEWMVANNLIPPARPSTWTTPQEQFEADLTRRCTRDGVLYPSTAAVRNAARKVHMPKAALEIEPWFEDPDPVKNANPLREELKLPVLHAIACILEYEGDDYERLSSGINREFLVAFYARGYMSDLLTSDRAAQPPIFPNTARAFARLARWLSDEASPVDEYVEAHARALIAPAEASGVRTWYDPTGSLPASRYFAYQSLLRAGAGKYERPWHTIERQLHKAPARHDHLRAWIDEMSGAHAS